MFPQFAERSEWAQWGLVKMCSLAPDCGIDREKLTAVAGRAFADNDRLGLAVGMKLTEKMAGTSNQLTGGLITMGVLAVLSVPLMRWAVCLLGAAAGGIFTSGIWYACGLPESYMWAGGLVGVVAGGMISFIVFKVAVILFSSLWGSGLIVTSPASFIWSLSGVSQTSILVPLTFMVQLPHIPCRQERRKVRLPSCSPLISCRASRMVLPGVKSTWKSST